MRYAAARSIRRWSWRTAFKAAVISGILGLGLCVTGAIVSDHTKPPKHAATAEVTHIINCYRNQCGYQVIYITAQEIPEMATIPAPAGEARLLSQVAIYYQDASPATARFADTDYAGNLGDPLYGLGVVLILFALVMLLLSVARLLRTQADGQGHHERRRSLRETVPQRPASTRPHARH
jgi:hypothetical protein